MKEQIEKTRKFHRKHGFSLDKDLTSYKSNINLSNFFKDIATNVLLLAAEDIEKMMLNEHDPRLARIQLMIEELGETILGLSNCDEVETLDGLSDLVYVVIGTAIAFDLPLFEGLDAVCDSNLTKSLRKKGDVRLRNKGPDYCSPDLRQVLLRYRGKDV